jgi:hypothetical protein
VGALGGSFTVFDMFFFGNVVYTLFSNIYDLDNNGKGEGAEFDDSRPSN